MGRIVIRIIEIVLAIAIVVTGVFLYLSISREQNAKSNVEQLANIYTGTKKGTATGSHTNNTGNTGNSNVNVINGIPIHSGPSASNSETPDENEDPAESLYIAADFASLKGINKEIIGWVMIPGTNVNCPVLQCGNNDKYLKTNYDGSYIYCGSVFMDWRTDAANSNVLLMYGHNMGNNKAIMFSELVGYKKTSYFQTHPEIIWAYDDGTPNGKEYVFKVFAVCVADSKKDSDIQSFYASGFNTKAEYEAYVKNLYAHSLYSTGYQGIPKQVIALGTCDRSFGINGRLVIYGGLFEDVD